MIEKIKGQKPNNWTRNLKSSLFSLCITYYCSQSCRMGIYFTQTINIVALTWRHSKGAICYDAPFPKIVHTDRLLSGSQVKAIDKSITKSPENTSLLDHQRCLKSRKLSSVLCNATGLQGSMLFLHILTILTNYRVLNTTNTQLIDL